MTRAELTAKELLLQAPARRVTVELHGRMMEPFLRQGDLLMLRAVEPPDIRRGDVVTVRFLDKFPTCRITRVQGDRLTLTADGWPDFCLEAASGDIVGKLVRRTRAGRDLECDTWRWRAHAAVAMAREAVRSLAPRVRRKRAQFALR